MSEARNNSQGQKPENYDLAKWSLVFALTSVLGLIGSGFIPVVAFSFPICDQFFFICCLIAVPLSVLLAVVLGVTSIRRIGRSKGQLRGSRLAIAGLVTAGVVSCAFVYGGIRTVNRVITLFNVTACTMHLSDLAGAMAIYASEHDGNYPTGDKWCDLLIELEYVTEKSFQCPANKNGPCSYALNRNIVGLKQSSIPPDVVVLFESSAGWNRVGGPVVLNTQNHNGKACSVSFNDSSVRFVEAGELGKLRWKVEDGQK